MEKKNVTKIETPANSGDELPFIRPVDLMRDLINDYVAIKELIGEVSRVVAEGAEPSQSQDVLAEVYVVAAVEMAHGVEWSADVVISMRDFDAFQRFDAAFAQKQVTYQTDGRLISSDFDFDNPRVGPPPEIIRDVSGRVIDCLVNDEVAVRIRIHERLNCVVVEFR